MWTDKNKHNEAGFGPHLKKTINQSSLTMGKYHCTADLPFDWFGFVKTSKTVAQYFKQFVILERL